MSVDFSKNINYHSGYNTMYLVRIDSIFKGRKMSTKARLFMKMSQKKGIMQLSESLLTYLELFIKPKKLTMK